MMRLHILRTLLYKEYLRYSYNWGLLVVVGALLALAALVSISSRSSGVPGLTAPDVRTCFINYRVGTKDEEWVRQLQGKGPLPCEIIYTGNPAPLTTPQLAAEEMAIELEAPAAGATWTARFWYVGAPPAGSVPVRNWFVRVTNDYLQTRPRLREETREAEFLQGSRPPERVPLIVTALAIFALYLLSFNLYVTSTGEEREKRVLLGLLLTPAAPVEVIAAKAIFYAAASLLVALAVVGMYQPLLLLNPFLWGGVICGSVSYVAIGTVVISLVRRQSTINTVSMLYLIATSIIMILSQFLPLFLAVQFVLVENYLHGLMKLIIAGERPSPEMIGYMIMLGVATASWSIVAVWIFSKRATAIAHVR
jgi:hypothetical protein